MNLVTDKVRNGLDTAGAILGGTLVGLGADLESATLAFTGVGLVFTCLVYLASRNG